MKEPRQFLRDRKPFESSDAFNSAFEEQVVRPVKLAKGALSRAEFEKVEGENKEIKVREEAKRETNLREQTKQAIADQEEHEEKVRKEKVLQQQIAKIDLPEVQARRKAHRDRLDERTDRILAKRKERLEKVSQEDDESISQKNRTWKNVVETYLAYGENGVREELFDPVRNGKSLTREMLERDVPLQKQLRVMLVTDSKKRTFENFMAAVPAEQDYVRELERVIALGDWDRKIKAYSKVASANEVVDLGGADVAGENDDYASFEISDQQIQPLDEPKKLNNKNVVRRTYPSSEGGVARGLEGKIKIPSVVKNKNHRGSNAGEKDIHEKFDTSDVKDTMSGNSEAPYPFVNSKTKQEMQAQQNQDVSLVAKDKAEAAYAKAYRQYDPQFTQGKTDKQIAIIRPPLLAGFLRSVDSLGKNLKRLYAEMVRVKEEISEYEEKQKITESLRKHVLAKPKGSVVSPELQRASAGSDYPEVEQEWFATSKQVQASAQVDRLTEKRALPSLEKIKEAAEKVKPGFTSPVIEQFKSAKTVQEGIASIQKNVDAGVVERARPIQQRLQQIEQYFNDKDLDLQNRTIRQFLLQEDITGWTKWTQKGLQQEYRKLYNSSDYQKYQAL